MRSRLVISFIAVCLVSSCSSDTSLSPESYGATAGSEAAKSWKAWSTEPQPSTDSAAMFCADIAEEGAEKYRWTVKEIFQAADSCANSFTQELFRK